MSERNRQQGFQVYDLKIKPVDPTLQWRSRVIKARVEQKAEVRK